MELAGHDMRLGDTKEQHQAKYDRKVRELQRRGWSEAQIEVYMRKWSDTIISYKKANELLRERA